MGIHVPSCWRTHAIRANSNHDGHDSKAKLSCPLEASGAVSKSHSLGGLHLLVMPQDRQVPHHQSEAGLQLTL